jgi:hypothetical protein
VLGFLRRYLHRHVRRNIHRPWMQWSIGACALLSARRGFCSGGCKGDERGVVAGSRGIWVGRNCSLSPQFLLGYWLSIVCTRRTSAGACGRIMAITVMSHSQRRSLMRRGLPLA